MQRCKCISCNHSKHLYLMKVSFCLKESFHLLSATVLWLFFCSQLQQRNSHFHRFHLPLAIVLPLLWKNVNLLKQHHPRVLSHTEPIYQGRKCSHFWIVFQWIQTSLLPNKLHIIKGEYFRFLKMWSRLNLLFNS